MSDDHASMAMSCYGSYRNRTPNIDRIADEGVRLDNCFCTNSICTPSRASILTGLYAHKTGSIVFNAPDPRNVTFPQLLRNAGYFTALIGKWHLHSEPTGFDRWAVVPGQGKYFDPVFVDQGVTRTIPGYVTDITTDLAIDALENRPGDQPFCMLCHHKAPHDPWEAHPRHEELYPTGSIAEPDNLFDDYATRARAVTESTQRIGSEHPGHTLYEKETGSIGDPDERMRAQYQIYMQRYLRCVAAIDEGVGRLLDYLDEQGLTENTIVVYTSDQGFFLGEHGWYDKRFMYEESLRMPFVMRYPAALAAGSTDDHLILNTDFAPTFLDYAGIEPPESMQGTSFREVVSGGTETEWRDAFYYRYYYSHFRTPAHWGIRTHRHKLIYYHASDEWELFDLEADPAEMNNVYDRPENAKLVADLKHRLDELRDDVDDSEDGAAGDERAAVLMHEPGHPMF
jgi:arylsulfatase A-like enzyme